MLCKTCTPIYVRACLLCCGLCLAGTLSGLLQALLVAFCGLQNLWPDWICSSCFFFGPWPDVGRLHPSRGWASGTRVTDPSPRRELRPRSRPVVALLPGCLIPLHTILIPCFVLLPRVSLPPSLPCRENTLSSIPFLPPPQERNYLRVLLVGSLAMLAIPIYDEYNFEIW